ncbi:uncharacterized protein LOC121048432 [Ixodes scapularis]|uniref:uncharacterized protein LOC121048432 n=1 Tax=Ixodes scapularis TaxID=6945 RepID=UPI001C387405|nr:uncharacterized protein LOC121048432 [Ixodes scapularis]
MPSDCSLLHDYTEMQLKAVITCHCTVFPAEDIELMVKARRKMFGDISTFQLVSRYCKTAPALLRNFKENAELIGNMMTICSNATLYYLPLTPNS